jgi:hypothetical protein
MAPHDTWPRGGTRGRDPAEGCMERAGAAELGHTLGTDARRGPVAAGHHRTAQDRPPTLLQQVGDDFVSLQVVPPAGFEPATHGLGNRRAVRCGSGLSDRRRFDWMAGLIGGLDAI